MSHHKIRHAGPADPLTHCFVEEGHPVLEPEELAEKYKIGACVNMNPGLRITESRLFDHKGAKVLEVYIKDFNGRPKLIWVLAKPNRPMKDLPEYSPVLRHVPIPLIHCDPVLVDNEIALDAARRKVQEEFDAYWKL